MMFDELTDTHPILHVLAGSPHFAKAEPVADIAKTSSDLYLALARTIEREVIPRLLLNTRSELARRDAIEALAAARVPHDVVKFCQIILTGDLANAEDYVSREIEDGASLETLLLEIFAPTARRLGELWESDEATFVDVTIALGKLQQLLRIFSEAYRAEPDARKLGFRALLATVPGNQHVFGIFVVEELFRHSGWNVLSLPSPHRTELVEAVAQEWFAVIGLSVSCDNNMADVAALISDLRAASLNRSVIVLVGGRYVVDNPEDAAQFGADLVGADAQAAIERSQDFLRSIGR